MDSAWIFRICLFMGILLIVFADFLVARKDDDEREETANLFVDKQNDENYIMNNHNPKSIKSTLKMANDDKLDIKLFKNTFNEKQNIDQKKVILNVQDKINDSLRDLCLPKLLCEIAAKPNYLLSDKERHVLSLLKSTSLSDSPSIWHFSSHMGQLMRHSADSLGGPMGCAMLWPKCPYSSDKLMKMSNKVRLK
ncbi:unnamed protein product [Diamesa serratosioi]